MVKEGGARLQIHTPALDEEFCDYLGFHEGAHVGADFVHDVDDAQHDQQIPQIEFGPFSVQLPLAALELFFLPDTADGTGGFGFGLCHDGYLFSVRMNKITISHILIIVYPAEEKGLQKGSDHAMIA